MRHVLFGFETETSIRGGGAGPLPAVLVRVNPEYVERMVLLGEDGVRYGFKLVELHDGPGTHLLAMFPLDA